MINSSFLHDSSELLHAFLSWTRTGSAKEQIFGWIISTVILGGVSTLLWRMTRMLQQVCLCASPAKFSLQGCVWRVFPVLSGLGSGSEQEYSASNPIHHPQGHFERRASLPERRQQRQKRYLPWKRNQGRVLSSVRHAVTRRPERKADHCMEFSEAAWWRHGPVTCGVMSCINVHHEPYAVPVLLSETPLSREAAEGGLAILAAPRTLTRTLRQEVYDFLKAFPPSDREEEEFEHGTSPKGPLVQKSGWKRKLRIWLEID